MLTTSICGQLEHAPTTTLRLRTDSLIGLPSTASPVGTYLGALMPASLGAPSYFIGAFDGEAAADVVVLRYSTGAGEFERIWARQRATEGVITYVLLRDTSSRGYAASAA